MPPLLDEDEGRMGARRAASASLARRAYRSGGRGACERRCMRDMAASRTSSGLDKAVELNDGWRWGRSGWGGEIRSRENESSGERMLLLDRSEVKDPETLGLRDASCDVGPAAEEGKSVDRGGRTNSVVGVMEDNEERRLESEGRLGGTGGPTCSMLAK